MDNTDHTPKRGRKPANPALGPRSASDRKRKQQASQWERINNQEPEQWTAADCLLVLTHSRYPAGTPINKAAWQQLGKLRGYL